MPAINETSWTLMLPTVDHVFYGRPVAAYLDGAGFVVGGHDRRSYAALNRMLSEEQGGYRDGGKGRSIPINARWVIFHTTCGCSPEQHAKHGAPVPDTYLDLDNIFGECVDHCVEDRCGLPPCEDVYSWMATPAKEDTPGAVPVLEVLW